MIDPGAAAEFIVRRLYRRVPMGEGARFAIAETEHPFAGDNWFWTDDNAKIVEFLAHASVRRRYARETGEIVRFLEAMCRGPLIFRRVSLPRLHPTGQQGNEAGYYHSLMHLRADLPRGAVVAGIRFHDNRTADNLLLHTNSVEFTHRGRRHELPVEAAIDQSAAVIEGDRMELRFSAELRFRRKRRVGRITYVYTLDARSMVIGVEAALDVDSAADIHDVVLSVGHDHLSHGAGGVHYGRIHAKAPGRDIMRVAAEPGRTVLAAAGATYYALVQAELPGFALAVHSAPREPGLLAEIELLSRHRGFLHFARARYRFAGACRGRRLIAAEDKLLTAGGFYDRVDDYDALLSEAAHSAAAGTAIDFSISYDYGAELNAFAQYFAALTAEGADAAARNAAKSLVDTYLATYFELFIAGHQRNENTVFSRQLAFVIVALVTMHRATGSAEYRGRLGQLCDVMLSFEARFDDIAGDPVSGFMMGQHSARIVFVDCHSAALFALTVAAAYVEDPRIAAAIDRGLGCYAIETQRIDWHDGPHKIDAIAVNWVDDHGARHTNHGWWSYHGGLTLRFFAALRQSADPALQAIAARHGQRIELYEMMIRWHLERSLSWHDGAVEIRCSPLSTETNSETQPWAMLGVIERGWAQGAPTAETPLALASTG